MEKQNFTVISGETRHQLLFDDAALSTGSINGQPFSCDVREEKEGHIHLLRDHVSYEAEIIAFDESTKQVTVKVNGRKYSVTVRDKYDELLASLGMDNLAGRKVNEMKAPMPGLVLNVLVEEGTSIKKGDALVILEAMKMENILKSPTDGSIKKIAVKKGVAVEKNQLLIEFA